MSEKRQDLTDIAREYKICITLDESEKSFLDGIEEVCYQNEIAMIKLFMYGVLDYEELLKFSRKYWGMDEEELRRELRYYEDFLC